MDYFETNPNTILKNLKSELDGINQKIEAAIQQKNLGSDEISTTIEYLNNAIRHLDHAVENLLECKSRTTSE